MTLSFEKRINILPKDGALYYNKHFLNPERALALIPKLLKEVNFKNDESIIFGKHYVMNRLTGWVGDESFSYGYSQIKREAQLWTESLLKIKDLVEKSSGFKYNSCLLNYLSLIHI